MKYDDIQRQLNGQQYYPIYLLQGNEPFFIDQIAKRLEDEVLSEAQSSFNKIILYGKDTDIDTVITTARRYPMMSPYQVVIIKEAHLLKDIQKLEHYAKNPAPTTILVLVHKYKSLRSNSKLGKMITKKGVVFVSKKLYPKDVPRWIEQYLKKQNYKIEHPALSLLTEYLGTNLSKVANELDKLMLNVPKTTAITAAHISENIGISKDYNVFELQKALSNKQTEKVFKIVHYFSNNPKSAPFMLLIGGLYTYFNRIYLMHHFKQKRDDELQKVLGLHNRFFVNEYRTAIRNFTVKQTKRNLRLLQEFDMKFKGVNNASTKEAELLKEMIARMVI